MSTINYEILEDNRTGCAIDLNISTDFLGFLNFQVIEDSKNIQLTLSDVYYLDINDNNTKVENFINANINFDIVDDGKIGLSDVLSMMKYLSKD